MKILFIGSDINQIGGIEKYNRIFLSSLREQGIDVSLIERKKGGFFSKLFFAIRVLFFAIFKNPDFIICAHLYFSPICYWLKKILGIKYSVSVYGIEVANIQAEIFKKSLADASRIIYLFEATASRVVEQIPGVELKLFNVPNSIDGDAFKIKEKLPSLVSHLNLQNKKIVITIGRMSKLDGNNKGYRRVIDAMSEVIKTVPRAIYLLVGSGDDVSDVRELIQKKNLEKHVFVIPAPTNEELVDYYNVADVFAMPSKNEGFPPIVILEALACGVPVVAGNQRGAEALIANKFGVVVPSDDVSAVSHAIVKILMGQDFNRQTLHKNIVEIFGMETYKERVRQFITHIHV